MIDDRVYFHEKLAQAAPIVWEKFEPFKVTFRMGAPVSVTTPWISFDGLLAHLMLLDALGEDYLVMPKKLDLSEIFPQNRRLLPLKKTQDIYHASVSLFIPHSIRVTQIYKRFEERWAGALNRKKIYLGMGPFRAYMIQEPYIPCKEVVFYGFGDLNIIRNLIENYLCGLGNDFRIGFGAIRDISWETTDTDYSIVADGIAMRPIPISMCAEYEDAVYLPYKSPYWSPKNVVLCVPPGSKCKLKDELETGIQGLGTN
ncbi:MAG: hypothetical protein ACPLPW_08735 [bacterium]